MKKNILVAAYATSACILSHHAFAQHGDVPAQQNSAIPCCFGGFYAGAALGYGSHKAEINQALTIANVVLRRHANDLSLDGLNGGVFLGYGQAMRCSRVYLGLEVGYFFDGAKGDQTYTPSALGAGDILKTEAKRKDSIELAARMGWLFNQTMPYLKLGWANTNLEATRVFYSPLVPATTITQKFLDKRINGVLFGAGIEYKLNPCLIAGLEYTHVAYRKETGPWQKVTVTNNAPDAINNWASSAKLSDNHIRLRLTYQF